MISKNLPGLAKKIPRLQFETILLGPQLQAMRQSKQGAKERLYRHEKLIEVEEMIQQLDPAKGGADMVYNDIWCGSDFLELAGKLDLTSDDAVVASSIDGAQLYQNKKSDTWIAIWIVEDLHPSS